MKTETIRQLTEKYTCIIRVFVMGVIGTYTWNIGATKIGMTL